MGKQRPSFKTARGPGLEHVESWNKGSWSHSTRLLDWTKRSIKLWSKNPPWPHFCCIYMYMRIDLYKYYIYIYIYINIHVHMTGLKQQREKEHIQYQPIFPHILPGSAISLFMLATCTMSIQHIWWAIDKFKWVKPLHWCSSEVG